MKNRNKRLFVGGLNLDDHPRFIGEASYLNAENMRVTTSADGKVGTGEGLRSTRQPTIAATSYTIPPTGDNKVIGRYIDVEKNRIIYFVRNIPLADGPRGEHHILVYFADEDIVRLAFHDSIMSSQSPNKGLNWSDTEKISGIAMADDLLFWVDSNGPRQFNLERGIKLFHSDYTGADTAIPSILKDTDIKIIRKPPNYPPTWIWSQNSAIKSNEIRGKQFKFALRYKYTDGQLSVLSPYSLLADWNAKWESMAYQIDYNTIVVTPNANEVIPADVAEVHFLAQEGNTDWRVIEKIGVDSQLQMVFAHDRKGATVAPEQATKLFDAVPIHSEAVEAAGSRIFLGNNLHGYEKSPYAASMEFTAPSYISGATGLTGTYVVVWSLWDDDPTDQYPAANEFIKVLLKIDSHPGYNGYYEVGNTWVGYVPTASPPVQNFSSLATYVYLNGQPVLPLSASELDLVDYCNGPGFTGQMDDYDVVVLNTGGGYPSAPIPTVAGLTGSTAYRLGERIAKSGGRYKGGIVFYDEEMRTNGVISPLASVATIANRDFLMSKVSPGIGWEIIPQIADEISAKDRIPNWAHYYSIVRTRDLTRSYFVQGASSLVRYATTDSDGLYVIGASGFTGDSTAIAVDVTGLLNRGSGYAFLDGDRCMLTDTSGITTHHDVIGTEGKYVLLSPKNIGLLSGKSFVFEIYTPYKEGADELYYEFAQIFPISQPSTSFKNYSTFTGILPGDVYINTNDGGVWIESYSPTLEDELGLVDDCGRALIEVEGQYDRRTTEIAYSNTMIQGASVNNICRFDALDVYDGIDVQSGPLRHLVLVSKTQGLGNVMLGICESDTVSLYLGESIVADTEGDQFLSRTTGVIGTSRALRGGYGTINPESVCEYGGNIYWLDAVRKCVVRYNNNGLVPISQYKMRDFFNGRSAIAQGDSTVTIAAGYDPLHDEYIITMPGDSSVSPNYLEDIVRETASFDFGGVSFNGVWGSDQCVLDEQESLTFSGTWGTQYCALDEQDTTFSGTWGTDLCVMPEEERVSFLGTWGSSQCRLVQVVEYQAGWFNQYCTIFPGDYPFYNLVTNGDFSDGSTNWSIVNSNGAGWDVAIPEGLSYSGKYMHHEPVGSGSTDSFEQLLTVDETAGDLYRLRASITITSGTLSIYRLTSGADVLIDTVSASNTNYSKTFDPNGDFIGIKFAVNYDADVDIDSIQITR